jgi:hypothetical protein
MGSFILNFNPDRLITAANIIDNVLYFTDGENEPKRINIETFKAADHSNGTTSVYGRNFVERDITVIRPHPQAVINSNLSSEEDVPIDAKEPLVITGSAGVLNNFVRLTGSAIEAGTVFTQRGFYYYEASTEPSLSTIVASGTKVEASLNGGSSFTEDITPGADKKFYYVAYAKTQIGSTIYGGIVAFKTNAITTDFPTIETVGHEKVSNLRYTLKGKVTDNGGSPITEVGFYFYFLDFLTTTAAPSTLVGDENNPITNARKTVATNFNQSTGEFSIEISPPPFTIFYYQAYAVNSEDGQDEGDVKNQTVSEGEAPAIELRESTLYDTKAIVRAQITRKNGTIAKRGFYISKTSNNAFTMINQHSTNDTIYKVEDTTLNENNQLSEFSLDTSTISGLTIARGDTLYVMAYADNGLENQTGVLALNLRDGSGEAPSITTENVQVIDNSGNSRLRCTGRFNSMNFTGTGVQKLGFYITRTESGVVLGNDQEAKKAEMIRRYNTVPRTATEVVSVKTILGSQVNNTDPGAYIVSFDGDNVVPLENGFDYHIMAVGFNGSQIGTGDVLNTPTKTEADAPVFYTKQVGGITTSSGHFYGFVDPVTDPAIKQDLDDAGFTWSTSEDSLAVNHISISSGDLTALNTYITAGTGNGRFDVNKTGLLEDQKYYVRAYVTPSGGSKVYAPFDDDVANKGDGIVEFRTAKSAPSLPKINCSVGNVGRTTAVLNGSLTNDGGSNFNLMHLDPEFYYQRASDVTGSTDNDKKANIITNVGSNAKSATKGKIAANFDLVEAVYDNNVANSAYATLGGAQEYVLSDTSVPLQEGTKYFGFMVTTTSNGATSGESYGSLGNGKAISNLVSFTTDEAFDTAPWLDKVTVSSIGNDYAWFKVEQLSDGGNRDWTGIKYGYYYIKKSDLPSNYDPDDGLNAASELIADSDKVFIEESARSVGSNRMGSKQATGLEPGTEYYVIGAMENAVGIGYSQKATLFKTSGGTEGSGVDEIILKTPSTMYFNARGLAIAEDHIEFQVSPSNADVEIDVADWYVRGGFGAYDTPRAQIQRDDSGRIKIYVTSSSNPHAATRRSSITIKHSGNPAITKTVTLVQYGSLGVGVGDDDTDNMDLVF